MKTYQIDLSTQTFENMLKIHCEKEPNITHDVKFIIKNRPKHYNMFHEVQCIAKQSIGHPVGTLCFTYCYFEHIDETTDGLVLRPRFMEAQ